MIDCRQINFLKGTLRKFYDVRLTLKECDKDQIYVENRSKPKKMLKIMSFIVLKYFIFLSFLIQVKKKSQIAISFKLNTPLNGRN